MLRLASRTTASPPSPSRLRIARRAQQPQTQPAPHRAGAKGWTPGDPIVLGEEAQGRQGLQGEEDGVESAPLAKGRRWAPGDLIVFGATGDAAERALGQQQRSPPQQQPRAGTPASARPRASTVRTTHSPAAYPRSSSPFPRAPTHTGWPAASTRWDPPSSSPSLHSSLADFSTVAQSSAAVPSEPGMQAGSPTTRSGAPVQAPALSQAEMDDLVNGVDFDDALDPEVDLMPSPRALQPRASLAPEALEELVSGIDFSQDVDFSDGDEPARDAYLYAAASPSTAARLPPVPPSPQARASSPRIGIRTRAPLSPRPSPPQQTTDLFSPRSPALAALSLSRSSSLSGSPFRQSTPFLASPPPALGSSQLRAYSTTSPAQRREEDSSGELVPPSALGLGTDIDAKGKGKAPVIELSDNSPTSSPELVVLRKPASTSSAPAAAAKPKNGWFQRPASTAFSSLAGRPKPASPSPPASSSASKPAPSTSSFTARPKPPLARKPFAPKPSTSSFRAGKPRPGSKRAAEAEKQASLRAKWPRVFSYKTWAGERGAPRVVYTTDEAEVERVLSTLEGPLGFDLEWDPYVPRAGGMGGQGKAALVQVCDESTILLVHVARMSRFPPVLKQFVEDPERIKLGVQIAGDASKLTRDFGHAPTGTLELNAVVRHYDASRFVGRIKPGLIGLQELTGIYLDAYLPKEHDVRCARWSGQLSDEQLEYAANDVYASLYVLLAIQSLAGVSPEAAAPMLRQLSVTPYNGWSGFATSRAPTTTGAGAGTTYMLPALPEAQAGPATPQSVLTARKFEAFTLFHHERLPLDEITARMAASNAIQPLSVVWNILSAAARLRQYDVEVEWDTRRLVQFVDEVEGKSKGLMMKEHGALVEEWRKELAGEAPAQ
ncbi:hypothetical protein JCM10449v2_004155 [Rhodotorula kratochvilovae]